MLNPVHQIFGNQLRIRVCGICLDGGKILLVNHKGIKQGDFWAPPGGGLQFGESAEACLMREFEEETGLNVKIGDFLFACEFIHKPLHAVELFFLTDVIGGTLKKGQDPEMGDKQIIQEVRFFESNEINQLKPDERHGIFEKSQNGLKIVDLRGYFKL